MPVHRGSTALRPAAVGSSAWLYISECQPVYRRASISLEPQPAGARAPVVNDFSIQVATVNGSGSQTANLVLLRSIFQMGVPVSGKNLFPSNIAGLPTCTRFGPTTTATSAARRKSISSWR